MHRQLAAITALSLLALGLGVESASALDRRVRIINNTSYSIREFYASNVGTQSWQEDILGSDVLDPGSSVIVNIDDASGYCKFDFKAVFEDATETITERVNVCEIPEFTYNE